MGKWRSRGSCAGSRCSRRILVSELVSQTSSGACATAGYGELWMMKRTKGAPERRQRCQVRCRADLMWGPETRARSPRYQTHHRYIELICILHGFHYPVVIDTLWSFTWILDWSVALPPRTVLIARIRHTQRGLSATVSKSEHQAVVCLAWARKWPLWAVAAQALGHSGLCSLQIMRYIYSNSRTV